MNVMGAMMPLRGPSARALSPSRGSYGIEGRARSVPDEMVDRGLQRPLPDNTADIASWPDAHQPRRRRDLTRKRSRVVADPGRRLFLQPVMLPRRFRVLGCCAPCSSGRLAIGVLMQVTAPIC